MRFPVALGQAVRKSRTASEDENPRVRPALGLVFEEQECVFPSPRDKPCGRVGQPSEDENPRVRPALGLVFEEQECVFPSP